jgi:hypothetical protein
VINGWASFSDLQAEKYTFPLAAVETQMFRAEFIEDIIVLLDSGSLS